PNPTYVHYGAGVAFEALAQSNKLRLVREEATARPDRNESGFPRHAGGASPRVIDFVEEGGSRREAAEQFDVSVSSAIRWVQRFRENGTFEPMPSGGSTSPLEKHSRQILALISEVSDLTLNEI